MPWDQMMLPLDDPRWRELRHAYGAAIDIPDMLRALAISAGPSATCKDEPWFGLWSSLCHQGDAYTASYAAVPHIVRIAIATEAPINCSFFQMPAAIEVARSTGRGPAIPDADADAYHRALVDLMESVSRHRHEPWNQPMVLSAAAAQAAAKGHIDVAEALLNLDADWIARINSLDRDETCSSP